MRRRDFLKATGAAMTFCITTETNGLDRDIDTTRTREYLRFLMPSREQVHNFIHGRQGSEKLSRNQGWTFDSDLGWVLCDSIRPRSVDGSQGFYSYETDGARKVVNLSDKPCRIHTYGNSFTHCDQVSDGETWQEYLAAHIQEPIRNYGVGGYSVYQAFRRMLKVEKENGAQYIILNIWDDDHFRNLDSWRSIRFGRRTPCGFTLPHLRVNVQQDRCKQIENVCHKPQDVYKLCDEDFVWQTFKDDPVLKLVLAARSDEKVLQKLVKPVAGSFGITYRADSNTKAAQRIKKIHTEAALYATKNVVTWTEQFVNKTGRKLMVILSFSRGNIDKELRGMPRFDQNFINWLKNKPYPVIDMRDFFCADYKRFKADTNTYLKRYYIGHHNPAGNFFTAWAIKNRVVEWLEPSPAPYR